MINVVVVVLGLELKRRSLFLGIGLPQLLLTLSFSVSLIKTYQDPKIPRRFYFVIQYMILPWIFEANNDDDDDENIIFDFGFLLRFAHVAVS